MNYISSQRWKMKHLRSAKNYELVLRCSEQLFQNIMAEKGKVVTTRSPVQQIGSKAIFSHTHPSIRVFVMSFACLL